MVPVPTSVAKQAELLRLDGNTYFKKDRIGAAIDAYTEVFLQSNPNFFFSFASCDGDRFSDGFWPGYCDRMFGLGFI